MKKGGFLCSMVNQSEYIEKQLHNLGERIKQLRKAKGYSNYEHFAFKHGFARSSISRFERGEDMRMSSLLKLLHALDVTLEEFFSEGFEEAKEKRET